MPTQGSDTGSIQSVTAEQQPHHRWLADTKEKIRSDYERLHAEAQNQQSQRAGYGSEASWADLLGKWLPPDYEVARNKYIIPEQGSDAFETDLVIFSPSYPDALRQREEVIVGGVVAAFSCKLTLDAAGLADGLDRAARLKAGIKPRTQTVRDQLIGPTTVGLLAHSHHWKKPDSTPLKNVQLRLDEAMRSASAPLDLIDYVCVADLGLWRSFKSSYIGPQILTNMEGPTPDQKVNGAVGTIMSLQQSEIDNPIAELVSSLLARFSYSDQRLAGLAQSLAATGTFGGGQGGTPRFWDIGSVYRDRVMQRLSRLTPEDPDWRPMY